MRYKALGLGLILALLGAAPAPAEQIAPKGAVACVSAGALFRYLDARESGDREAATALFNGDCRHLSGRSYALLEDHNGTVKILVFQRPGAWETAQVYYSLAEMLQVE